MSVLEYILFGTIFISFFPFFISIFLYVPFYVYYIKKYDSSNATGFNTEDWWDPSCLLGTIQYFIKKEYKKSDLKFINFHGNILTWALGYSGALLFGCTLITTVYLLVIGPTYK